MTNLGIYKIEVDVANLANGSSLAAYLTSASGALITSVAVNGNESLRVVQASQFAEDAPHTSGDMGIQILGVRRDADTSPVSADGDYHALQFGPTGRLKVDAEVSVSSDYVFNEDQATVGGELGAYVLAVRQDTLASSTSADGDFASFKVNALGALYVTGSVTLGGQFAEDSVATNADTGLHMLAVRNDALASTVSASGDYASMHQWSEGSLKVVDLPNIGITSVAVSITNTAGGTSLGAAVANRRSVIIQNRGTVSIFLGPTGVTAASGLEIPRGASLDMEIGPAVTLFAITAAGTADVRFVQLS